jgi:peptidoglycan/LPS O-acetylase OafA/YrhL
LLAGVSIAALYNYLPAHFSRVSKYANMVMAAGLVLLTIAYFICENPYGFGRSIIGFPLVAVGFGCMVLGSIMPAGFLYKCKSAILSMIARLSYSLYLIHMGVILMVQELVSNWGIAKDSNWMFVLCMICCVAMALLLYYSIEKPFMKMRERFLQTAASPKGEMKVAYVAEKN